MPWRYRATTGSSTCRQPSAEVTLPGRNAHRSRSPNWLNRNSGGVAAARWQTQRGAGAAKGSTLARPKEEMPMTRNGRVVFSRMEEVVFGRPAAQAVAEQAARLGAARVMVMASATLDRDTDQVARVRDALGHRFAAQYQGMPAHSPRRAVL